MEWSPGGAIAYDSAFIDFPEERLILLEAVRYNDMDMILRHLNHGAYINEKHEGDPCIIKLPYLYRPIKMTGYTCLHVAVLHSDIQMLEFLLSRDGDINIRDGNERTSLYLATAVGRLDIVDYLLKQGADPNIQTHSKRTAIMEAICRQDLPVTERLLQAKCDLNLTDIKGGTALYFACTSHNADLNIIKALVKAGVDVNKTNSKGASVFMMIVRNTHIETLKLLYSAGADINLKDTDGRSAFHLAIENVGTKGSMIPVDFLLEHGADADSPDKKGLTPLQKAVKFGKLRCIERLLQVDCQRSYDMLESWRIVQLCEALPKFKDWLHKEFFTPRSLLRLSRGAVRKTLAEHVGKIDTQSLDIPQFLKNYLLGNDYDPLEFT